MYLQNHHVRRSPLIFLWNTGERKKFVPKWSGVVKKERGGGGEIFSFFPLPLPSPPCTIHYNSISNMADPKKNHELATLTWLHYRLESILPKNLTEGKWKWKEQFKESIYQVILFFFFFSFFLFFPCVIMILMLFCSTKGSVPVFWCISRCDTALWTGS